MTQPCFDPAAFDGTDGELSPHPWLQWRHVRTNIAGSVDGSLPPVAATNPGEIQLVDFEVAWTNSSPIMQRAYAMVTRDGSAVSLNARNIAYINRYEGISSGSAPDVPALVLAGRHGVGADHGLEAFNNPRYLVVESRDGQKTSLLGPTVTLAPGQSIRARVSLTFQVQNQETVAIWQGVNETEMRYLTGASRLDLYAYPVL